MGTVQAVLFSLGERRSLIFWMSYWSCASHDANMIYYASTDILNSFQPFATPRGACTDHFLRSVGRMVRCGCLPIRQSSSTLVVASNHDPAERRHFFSPLRRDYHSISQKALCMFRTCVARRILTKHLVTIMRYTLQQDGIV